MALESFATPDLMAARSQGAIAANHPYLQHALDAASRLIRNECGWHVSKVESLSKTFRGYRYGVWLPAMQIKTVTSITADDVVEDITQYAFDADTGWVGVAGSLVTVEYTAGYTEHPADLVDLTLQIAARALGSPLGIVREQAGAVSVTYSQAGFNVAGGSVLLDHEKAQLAAYKMGRLP